MYGQCEMRPTAHACPDSSYEIWAKCLYSNTCSHNISDMHEDVDFAGWELPPLQDDPDREPPPEREYRGGVWVGSDLAGLRHAGTGVLDLGSSFATASLRCGPPWWRWRSLARPTS